MVDPVYSKTFSKAAELLGGEKALARELRVPVGDLDKWIAGSAKPPLSIFLRVIDLVLDETSPQGGLSEAPDSGAPRDCAGGPSSIIL